MRKPVLRPRSRLESFRLSARDWNQRIEQIRRLRPLTVRGAADPSIPHAWALRLGWDGRQWCVRVRPGIVNGLPPVVRLEDPLRPGTRVDVSLHEEPAIPLADIRPVRAVPRWFAERFNIREADTARTVQDTDSGLRTVSDPAAAALLAARKGPKRSLYATGIGLVQERPTAVMDAGGDGRFAVRIQGTLGRPARLITGQGALDDPAVPSGLELVRGGRQDTGVDFIRVATVFFLSPRDWKPDDGRGVDGSFRPYIRQELFWNLSHHVAMPVLPARGLDISGFASQFSTGGDVIAGMLQDMERQDSLMGALLGEVLVRGAFWSL